MQTTQIDNPMKTYNHLHRVMLAKGSWEEAEKYRMTMGGTKPGTPSSMDQGKKTLVEERVQENIPVAPEFTKDEIIAKLKAKGVRGVHFIKSDDKLIEKAKEHGII